MNTYDVITNNFDELYHHGIKGQKWGIRRFQNQDGSLTSEGKKRYNIGSSFNSYIKSKFNRPINSPMDKPQNRSTNRKTPPINNPMDKPWKKKTSYSKGPKAPNPKETFKKVSKSTAKKAKNSYDKIKNNAVKSAAVAGSVVVGAAVCEHLFNKTIGSLSRLNVTDSSGKPLWTKFF